MHNVNFLSLREYLLEPWPLWEIFHRETLFRVHCHPYKIFEFLSRFWKKFSEVANNHSRSPVHPISVANVVEIYGTYSQDIYAHSCIFRFMLNTWRESSPISRENSFWLWKVENILDLLSASMAGAHIESLSSNSNQTVFDTLLSTYAYLFCTKFNAFCNLYW